MRRAALALLLVAFAPACGSSKPLSETARPCLAKLGQYVHHRPRPIPPTNTVVGLPVADPDFKPQAGRIFQNLPWPDDLDEYGEISFPSNKKGANAVQILMFTDDALPKRVIAQTRLVMRLQRRGQTSFFPPAPQPVRHGRTLLVWSSTPARGQRDSVYACLDS